MNHFSLEKRFLQIPIVESPLCWKRLRRHPLGRRGRLEAKHRKKGRVSPNHHHRVCGELFYSWRGEFTEFWQKLFLLFLGPVLLDEFVEWQKVRQTS